MKTPNGKTIALNFNKRDSIMDVKTKLEAKEGTPRRELRLTFAGEQLENCRTLVDYNIQKNMTLTASLRISGGGRKVAKGKEKKVEVYRSRFLKAREVVQEEAALRRAAEIEVDEKYTTRTVDALSLAPLSNLLDELDSIKTFTVDRVFPVAAFHLVPELNQLKMRAKLYLEQANVVESAYGVSYVREFSGDSGDTQNLEFYEYVKTRVAKLKMRRHQTPNTKHQHQTPTPNTNR